MFAEITAEQFLGVCAVTFVILLAGVVKIGKAVMGSEQGKGIVFGILAKFFRP